MSRALVSSPEDESSTIRGPVLVRFYTKGSYEDSRVTTEAIRNLAFAVALTIVVPTAASAAPVTIIGAWTDALGRTVFVRRGTYNGSTGFGMAKIQQRPAIYSIDSLKFVTRNPNGGVAEGLDRRYDAYANREECTLSVCVVTDSIPVRVIMSSQYATTSYGVTINGAIGIKTAYCTMPAGALKCPIWVDRALAGVSFRQVTVDGEASHVETTWTYNPLPVG